MQFIIVLWHFPVVFRAICRPILPVFEITQVDGYRSVFNIYSTSVYPPRYFSAVSSSVTSHSCYYRFPLSFSFSWFLPADSPGFRHEISILVSSRFHQSISPVCLPSHPLIVTVHPFALPLSIFISLEERALSHVRCFIKRLSNSVRSFSSLISFEINFNNTELSHVKNPLFYINHFSFIYEKLWTNYKNIQ